MAPRVLLLMEVVAANIYNDEIMHLYF